MKDLIKVFFRSFLLENSCGNTLHNLLPGINPYKRHKMVKHTQIIRRQQSTDCSSVFDRFMDLELKELTRCNIYKLLKYPLANTLGYRSTTKGREV